MTDKTWHIADESRTTWRAVLTAHRPLLLPVAHDALTAKLIERAGFAAFQIGGFALSGTHFAHPDVGLEDYGEKRPIFERIIAASHLPAMVDADDGYGDVKTVTRTVRGLERIGASALFFEDQKAPKRCGHMAGKSVVPVAEMQQKVRAAVAARSNPDTFLIARTDAIETDGLDEALRRAARYLEAGADGVYFDGARSEDDLKRIGAEFGSVPLATTVLERGGLTPWLAPEAMAELGFAMVLYPTTLLFRVTKALSDGLAALRAGLPLSETNSVDMTEFEEIVDMHRWVEIENAHPLPSTPPGNLVETFARLLLARLLDGGKDAKIG